MNLATLQKRLSGDEINELPLVHYEGPINLIRSASALCKAIPEIRKEPLLGFDTETKPTFRKGKINLPSLIQLATSSCVYLIQLSHVSFGPELADIFANPEQKKIGVGIDDDMRELSKLYQFTPAGQVDLGSIARRHNLWSQGLRPLSANFFQERISKGSQCSNWGASDLSPRQITYAATDAWIGRRIFVRMQEMGLVEEV